MYTLQYVPQCSKKLFVFPCERELCVHSGFFSITLCMQKPFNNIRRIYFMYYTYFIRRQCKILRGSYSHLCHNVELIVVLFDEHIHMGGITVYRPYYSTITSCLQVIHDICKKLTHTKYWTITIWIANIFVISLIV